MPLQPINGRTPFRDFGCTDRVAVAEQTGFVDRLVLGHGLSPFDGNEVLHLVGFGDRFDLTIRQHLYCGKILTIETDVKLRQGVENPVTRPTPT
jgi:hypothetical protein